MTLVFTARGSAPEYSLPPPANSRDVFCQVQGPKALVAAIRRASASSRWLLVPRAGLTLLVIEQNYGPVVTTRNAQAWLVLPPIQPTPLLHRVLPTLPAELEARHDQLAAGLATRLDKVRPSRLDGDELTRLFEHDAARWPDRYACWSRHRRRFVELAAPDPSDRTRWATALLDGFGRCASAGQ